MNNTLQHFVRKNISNIKKLILFKSSHISLGGKISLLGVVICFVSLFFPWVGSLGTIISSGNLQIESFTSFSNVLGRIGFFITITLMIIVFSLFSIQKKEKIRYFSLIHISDYISLLIGSIFIFLLSIHSFFLISGLQLFSSNIIYGKGIILSITGSFVMFFGVFIMKQEYRKNIKGSYINDVSTRGSHMGNIKDRGETEGNNNFEVEMKQKNNMKLPF